MNSVKSLAEIMNEHNYLYSEILSNKDKIESKSSVFKELKSAATAMLDQIVKLSTAELSYKDYQWIAQAAAQWQSVLAITFDNPVSIKLGEPKKILMPVSTSVLKEEELNNWIEQKAALIAYGKFREGRYESINMKDDLHLGEVFLALEVLEGRMNFALRISPKSYKRLANIWLKDVKLMMAYFQWEREKIFFRFHDRNFFDSCGHLQNMLINDGIKAKIEEFQPVREYLFKNYLDKSGKLLNPNESAELKKLIESKAYRISETTGSSDQFMNWLHAETYVKMFYENIIPAVEMNIEEKVRRVLKAFQFSKMSRFIIIDCFETAIAIYFLQSQTIKDLWDKSNEYVWRHNFLKMSRAATEWPALPFETSAEAEFWPSNISLNNEVACRFQFDGKRIHIKGVMLVDDRNMIMKALEEASSGNISQENKKALEELFLKSRQIFQNDPGGYPKSTVESIVDVDSWPNLTLDAPVKHRFWANNKQIRYKGVMRQEEYDTLKVALETASPYMVRDEHYKALHDLFIQSRLIFKETTL